MKEERAGGKRKEAALFAAAFFFRFLAVFKESINSHNNNYKNAGDDSEDHKGEDGGVLSNFVLPAKNVRF